MPTCATLSHTDALRSMALTRVERAKITDSALKIQSAQASLETLDEDKVEEFAQIQECLEMADANLRRALRENGSAG
jgi:hypothetical protein